MHPARQHAGIIWDRSELGTWTVGVSAGASGTPQDKSNQPNLEALGPLEMQCIARAVRLSNIVGQEHREGRRDASDSSYGLRHKKRGLSLIRAVPASLDTIPHPEFHQSAYHAGSGTPLQGWRERGRENGGRQLVVDCRLGLVVSVCCRSSSFPTSKRNKSVWSRRLRAGKHSG